MYIFGGEMADKICIYYRVYVRYVFIDMAFDAFAFATTTNWGDRIIFSWEFFFFGFDHARIIHLLVSSWIGLKMNKKKRRLDEKNEDEKTKIRKMTCRHLKFQSNSIFFWPFDPSK